MVMIISRSRSIWRHCTQLYICKCNQRSLWAVNVKRPWSPCTSTVSIFLSSCKQYLSLPCSFRPCGHHPSWSESDFPIFFCTNLFELLSKWQDEDAVVWQRNSDSATLLTLQSESMKQRAKRLTIWFHTYTIRGWQKSILRSAMSLHPQRQAWQ